MDFCGSIKLVDYKNFNELRISPDGYPQIGIVKYTFDENGNPILEKNAIISFANFATYNPIYDVSIPINGSAVLVKGTQETTYSGKPIDHPIDQLTIPLAGTITVGGTVGTAETITIYGGQDESNLVELCSFTAVGTKEIDSEMLMKLIPSDTTSIKGFYFKATSNLTSSSATVSVSFGFMVLPYIIDVYDL